MLALLLAPLLLSGSPTQVSSPTRWRIPIVNPGFEQTSRPLAPGEWTNGMGGAGVPVGTRPSFYEPVSFDDPVEVLGWRTYLPPGQPTLNAGVLHPPTSLQGQPWVTGHGGQYVAMAHHQWSQQTLRARVRPGVRYRLDFLCGNGAWEPGDGVYVALLATPDAKTLAIPGTPGVTTLALTSGLHPPFGSEGLMLPWHLVWEAPDPLPASIQGHRLAIAFVGSDGIPLMNFDDFELHATRRLPPAPDPRPRP